MGSDDCQAEEYIYHYTLVCEITRTGREKPHAVFLQEALDDYTPCIIHFVITYLL